MEEIIKALREFDAKRNWNEYDLVQTEEQTIEALYKSLVHLMGEIGEFANELKKCRRDNNFNESGNWIGGSNIRLYSLVNCQWSDIVTHQLQFI